MNLNPFSSKKEDNLEQAAQASAVQAVTPFMNQTAASDAQSDRELGIDKILLGDDDLIKFIERLCEEERGECVLQPVVAKNADGSVIMQQEPVSVNGTIVLVQKPLVLMQPVMFKKKITRPWAYALRAYLSSIFPGRCIDPYDVDTYKLQVRCDFAEMIDDMPPEDIRDFSQLVSVLERFVETAFDDAKSDGKAGRKGMLIKVKRGELAIGMHRGLPNQGGKQQ
jgi:hypothetical protein